jgi:TPR repeat protein
MSKDGIGGPVDLTRAVELFERGCDGGNPGACLNLGVAVLRGVGGLEADSERAVELFKDACERGEQVACNNLEKVVPSRAAESPDDATAPQWKTNIGSLTIGAGDKTATFKDVRSTCNGFRLALAFGTAAGDVRKCLDGTATYRVLVAIEEGRLISSSVEPDDSAGRCTTNALGNAHLGKLTCTFEANVSR